MNEAAFLGQFLHGIGTRSAGDGQTSRILSPTVASPLESESKQKHATSSSSSARTRATPPSDQRTDPASVHFSIATWDAGRPLIMTSGELWPSSRRCYSLARGVTHFRVTAQRALLVVRDSRELSAPRGQASDNEASAANWQRHGNVLRCGNQGCTHRLRTVAVTRYFLPQHSEPGDPPCDFLSPVYCCSWLPTWLWLAHRPLQPTCSSLPAATTRTRAPKTSRWRRLPRPAMPCGN